MSVACQFAATAFINVLFMLYGSICNIFSIEFRNSNYTFY